VSVRRRASGRAHYNYFRNYDSVTGRFTESDPLGLRAGSTNTYAYVSGNPVAILDRFGLQDSNTGTTPNSPDPTGVREKWRLACEAEEARSAAEARAHEARAQGDWKKYEEEMTRAYRWLQRYHRLLDQGFTAPRTPEPTEARNTKTPEAPPPPPPVDIPMPDFQIKP
jgi:RHS repeat-associated protein